jgi:hypothetical protein
MKIKIFLLIFCAFSCNAGDRLARIGGFTGGGGRYDTPQIITNNAALSHNRYLLHQETIRRMKLNPVERPPLSQPKPKVAATTNSAAIK